MGWPDSATYAERESEYLAEEIHALDEILTELEKQPGNPWCSTPLERHLYGNNLLMRLRRQMTIVHLAASAQEQQLQLKDICTIPSRLCGASVSTQAEKNRARRWRLLSGADRRAAAEYRSAGALHAAGCSAARWLSGCGGVFENVLDKTGSAR